MDKIKILIEIVKFKIIFFTGVIAGSSYMILNFQDFVTFFGGSKISNVVTISIINILYTYGVIGIIKNLRSLSRIERKFKDELE
jgi:hypothetical protein